MIIGSRKPKNATISGVRLSHPSSVLIHTLPIKKNKKVLIDPALMTHIHGLTKGRGGQCGMLWLANLGYVPTSRQSKLDLFVVQCVPTSVIHSSLSPEGHLSTSGDIF